MTHVNSLVLDQAIKNLRQLATRWIGFDDADLGAAATIQLFIDAGGAPTTPASWNCAFVQYLLDRDIFITDIWGDVSLVERIIHESNDPFETWDQTGADFRRAIPRAGYVCFYTQWTNVDDTSTDEEDLRCGIVKERFENTVTIIEGDQDIGGNKKAVAEKTLNLIGDKDEFIVGFLQPFVQT